MTVSEAERPSRLRTAAPVAAAALAIVAAIAGGSLLTNKSQPEQIPVGTTASTATAPETPPSGGGLASVQFDQVTPGAPAGAQDMEIVVKFKDDAKVKDIIDAFWKDQGGGSARSKFETFKAGHPEFADLKLDRVTYSNELVLVHEGGATADRRLAAMREIAAKLKSASDISYAEPNMTAHPGGQ